MVYHGRPIKWPLLLLPPQDKAPSLGLLLGRGRAVKSISLLCSSLGVLTLRWSLLSPPQQLANTGAFLCLCCPCLSPDVDLETEPWLATSSEAQDSGSWEIIAPCQPCPGALPHPGTESPGSRDSGAPRHCSGQGPSGLSSSEDPRAPSGLALTVTCMVSLRWS